MLKTRLLLGTCMTGAFLGIFLFDYYCGLSAGFALVLGLFTVASLVEFFRLQTNTGKDASLGLCVLFGLLLILLKWAHKDLGALLVRSDALRLLAANPEFPVFLTFFAFIFLSHLYKGVRENTMESIGVSLFGFIYVVFFFTFLHSLRNMEIGGIPSFGIRAVLLVVLVAKAGDIGAYLIGRAAGKRKLYPAVSPNKTIEGSAAGLVFSVLASLGLASLFGLSGFFPSLFLVIFGLCVGAAAQLGDLVESLFKRVSRVKDSGRLLPAFGGSLDIVDCILFAGPAGYCAITLFVFFFKG